MVCPLWGLYILGFPWGVHKRRIAFPHIWYLRWWIFRYAGLVKAALTGDWVWKPVEWWIPTPNLLCVMDQTVGRSYGAANLFRAQTAFYITHLSRSIETSRKHYSFTLDHPSYLHIHKNNQLLSSGGGFLLRVISLHDVRQKLFKSSSNQKTVD